MYVIDLIASVKLMSSKSSMYNSIGFQTLLNFLSIICVGLNFWARFVPPIYLELSNCWGRGVRMLFEYLSWFNPVTDLAQGVQAKRSTQLLLSRLGK